jgi:hypothetical protein
MSATNTATFATSPHLLIDPDDRVMTLSEWFAVNRISPATGRRLIKSGKGPIIGLGTLCPSETGSLICRLVSRNFVIRWNAASI